jgi:hypothetical protein
VLYDEEAYVEPVRIVHYFDKVGLLNEGDPYPSLNCIPQSFPVGGFATPMAPGATFEYRLPDIYGRPWAEIWERYHEEGMTPPESEPELFGL